MRLPPP
ncbi:hypothetical protein YPPY103_0176, partial [Yersinia pestis PY-103]